MIGSEHAAPIRVLIVDDEPPARRRLTHLLKSDRRFTIVGEAGNGPDAVAAIATLTPDLVFLDVQMPEMDGFDVIRTIGIDRMPAVVFVTAYSQYALRAFEVSALDYLLKPFVVDRFRATLERSAERLAASSSRAAQHERVERLLRDLGKTTTYPERLLVSSGEKLVLVKTARIARVEAADKYVVLHGEEARYIVREGMAAMADRLDPRTFIRVHRSHIVNVDAIREVQPLFHGEAVLLLKNGDRIPLSRTYRKDFEAAFAR